MITLNEAGLPKLLDLVPALDRLNIEQQSNSQLVTLLAVLQSQADALGTNIDLLYQSWFIETCDDWTVSYIAKLIGLPNILSNATHIARQRALVANTMIYRSYRGTAHALSCAVQDATGWPIKIIEGIERQFTSAQVGISTPNQPVIFDITSESRLSAPPDVFNTDRISYSFYQTPVTPPTNDNAIAVYYWRDQIIERTGIQAYPLGDGLFHLDPAGRQLPLVMPEWGAGDMANDLPMSLPIPSLLNRRALSSILENNPQTLMSIFSLFVNGQQIPAHNIFVAALKKVMSKAWEKPFQQKAKYEPIAVIDPETGAVKIFTKPDKTCSEPPIVYSNHWQTTTGEIGGGIYDRSSRMIEADASTWSVLISSAPLSVDTLPKGFDAVFPDLSSAIHSWETKGYPEAIIHLTDNNRHTLPEKIDTGRTTSALVIQAAQGFHPALTGKCTVLGGAGCEVWVSGCYVTDVLSIGGKINMVFVDCTLWQHANSPICHQVIADSYTNTDQITISFDHCFSGPLQMTNHNCILSVSDCVIDGRGGPALSGTNHQGDQKNESEIAHTIGAALAASTTTFLGDVYSMQLNMTEDTLIVGNLHTPHASHTTPSEGVWVAQQQTTETDIISRVSGMPGYAVLGPDNPIELLEGASEGSEFGAWHSQFNARRLQAAHEVIKHYCPVGMTTEFIDANLTSAKKWS